MSLEEVLARWMRRNATDVVAVLDFLRRNPFEFNTLCTLAALDCPPTILRFADPNGVYSPVSILSPGLGR